MRPAASWNHWLPVCAVKVYFAAPGSPRLVMMLITPRAASVPYNVDAAGPLRTSMLSISSGAMSLNRDTIPVCPLLVRTPSM